MILYYHAESDCVFIEQYEHIDWLHVDGAACDEVSDQKWAVDRYNAENPGYRVHLLHGWNNCTLGHDRCTVCDGGLGLCLVCGQGECELTTDCPGSRPTEEQNAAVCAGKLDYWSGVWL